MAEGKDLLQVLWSGADVLRGKMDANEYKTYLLGLVFYKYLSDSYLLKVYDLLNWLAELMKHRDAADSKRYKMLAAKFIDKYGIDTNGYDVIKGWRADASYFYIVKEFV